MLIDWMTARLPDAYLKPEDWQALRQLGDRILRFNAQSGEMVYETAAWDSIRSDSHGLSFRVGTDALWIMGSPARVCGDGCAVFGSGPAASLDLRMSLQAMIDFLGEHLKRKLPPSPSWVVTRVDVTGNLRLTDQTDVRAALAVLRGCEGGRYRVSAMAGDTVYWSHRSRLRKAKAYAKGAHLLYLMRKKHYEGRRYDTHELTASEKLLRLELTLGNEWFRRYAPNNTWYDLTPYQLTTEWESYFHRMIGDSMITSDNSLKARLFEVAPTPGRAKSAYLFWLMLRQEGWETVRDSVSKTQFYRNLGYLRSAGLGDGDIAAGTIVPLRRRVMECQMVQSWAELLAA